jgi:Tol biopolymer transport system component
MNDTRKILARGLGSFAPDPGGYERVLRRRDRKRRSQRVGAVAVALALTIAMIVAGARVRRGDGSAPASQVPKVGPVGPGVSLIEVGSGKTTPLVDLAKDPGSLDVSPDGNVIAYAAGDQIRLLRLDGRTQKLINASVCYWDCLVGTTVAWSPSGSQIAFDAISSDGWSLFVMNSDGSGVRQLTHVRNAIARAPAWSPDGSSLAFWTWPMAGGRVKLEVINVQTGTISRVPTQRLTQARHLAPIGYPEGPTWSPDGNWIAYSTRTPVDRAGIWLVHPDGTDAHLLVTGSSEGGLTWSPDGQQIASCERGQPIRTVGIPCSIAIVDVATGTTRVLATGATDAFDWSPLGYLVVVGLQ